MRRRTYLATTGTIATGATAGCLGIFSDDDEPDTDPEETEAPDPDATVEIVYSMGEVKISPTEFPRADYVTVKPSDDALDVTYEGEWTDADDDGTANDLDTLGEIGRIPDIEQGKELTITATYQDTTATIRTYVVGAADDATPAE